MVRFKALLFACVLMVLLGSTQSALAYKANVAPDLTSLVCNGRSITTNWDRSAGKPVYIEVLAAGASAFTFPKRKLTASELSAGSALFTLPNTVPSDTYTVVVTISTRKGLSDSSGCTATVS